MALKSKVSASFVPEGLFEMNLFCASSWRASPNRCGREMSDIDFFGGFLIGDLGRLVLSGDTRLGDLLRGATPSIAASKSADLSGDRRLGDRRRDASSIARESSMAETIFREKYDA